MFKNWSTFEKIWLLVSTLVITGLAIYWQSSSISLVSSVTGIICVVLVAKGKISSYLFGIVNAAAYGYVAYGYGLYGESDLNWFVFLPLQFIGLYVWLKNKKDNSLATNGEDIHMKRLSGKQWAFTVGFIIVTHLVYLQYLTFRESNLAGIDSLAVVLSIVAQVLMVMRFAEQWILWIVINIITITLWVIILLKSGGNDWTVLAMWVAFLVNSIYGWLNWRKNSKAEVN